jgi:acid stress-induced BolA-like protein IbaG/YrbA
MALQIINSGPKPEEIAEQMQGCIALAIEGAEITITPGGPGHFEIRVVSQAFEGRNRVQQQQLVYGAITHLMSGRTPPVHAVDRLECLLP